MIEGIELSALAPLTSLQVKTTNSLYRVVLVQWPEVYIQGGWRFPAPTRAHLFSPSTGEAGETGWICVGRRMEIRIDGGRLVTSPVVEIATTAPDDLSEN